MNYFNNNNYPQMNQPFYPQTQSNLEWIMVQTIPQVEQVQVRPGQKAWIMVQNEPVFALRTADNMGLVNTEYYKFEKYNPSEQNSSQYVTQEYLNSALKDMEGRVYESVMGYFNEPSKSN